MGVLWINYLIDLMMQLLSFIQFLTDFSDLLMGLTILGIGNSSVDLFINRALCKQGFEILALTGILAGQMFNFMFGYGISALIISFNLGSRTGLERVFHLFTYGKFLEDFSETLTLMILIFAIFALGMILVALVAGK